MFDGQQSFRQTGSERSREHLSHQAELPLTCLDYTRMGFCERNDRHLRVGVQVCRYIDLQVDRMGGSFLSPLPFPCMPIERFQIPDCGDKGGFLLPGHVCFSHLNLGQAPVSSEL